MAADKNALGRAAPPNAPPLEGAPGGTASEQAAGGGVLTYADASTRLVAYLLDAVIVSVVVFGAAAVMSALVGPVVRFAVVIRVDGARALLTAVVATIINAGYFVMLWMLWRATIGQRLLKLEVISAGRGGRLSLPQAMIRWVLVGAPGIAGGLLASLGGPTILIDAAILIWYLALLVTVAASSTKQGLHDKISGTIVTKAGRTVEFREPTQQQGPPVVH